MGRLEKIVVLTVLFLVAVILGVSLNRGDERPGGTAAPASVGDSMGELASLPAQGSPRADSRTAAARTDGPAGALSATVGGELAGQTPAATGTTSASEGSARPAPGPALPEQGAREGSGTVPGKTDSTPAPPEPSGGDRPVDSPPSGEPETPGIPPPPAPVSWLVSEEGLQPSRDPGAMLYTWAAGDSYAALAERYYGSRQQVARLHKANEGRSDATLQPGEVVFVPARAPAPDEVIDTTPAGAGQWFGGTYVVESGDILGKIAQRVYGSASKWRLIYEANRDVLASPDALQVGMKLRIPAND